MKLIFLFVLLLIGSIVGFGYYRTWQMQNSHLQQEFIKGTVPIEGPEGFYAGTANFPTGPWRGKKFDSEKNTGVNVIHTIAGETDRFSFKTETGKGIQDKDLEIIKIDYNIPSNSWPVRLVLDEIVEVTPDKFLGKMHVRIPYLPPFTLVYFRLKK